MEPHFVCPKWCGKQNQIGLKASCFGGDLRRSTFSYTCNYARWIDPIWASDAIERALNYIYDFGLVELIIAGDIAVRVANEYCA